jgi:hypothetical protein
VRRGGGAERPAWTAARERSDETGAGATTGTLRLRVSKANARKLRLARKAVTLAQATVRCASGRFTATLKPKGRQKRALRRLRGRIAATLELRMTGAGGVATDTAKLTVRGRPATS